VVRERVEHLEGGKCISGAAARGRAPATSSRYFEAAAIMARTESLTVEGACPSAQLIEPSAVALLAAVRDHFQQPHCRTSKASGPFRGRGVGYRVELAPARGLINAPPSHIWCVDDTRPFKPAIKELNFKKSLNLREVDDVEFKVAGLAYRYDDASVDGLRSLSSRLCKCCQVLCAVKRRNSRRTP